ncbi:Hypothetical predicted protein [Octopus vulgaris]|uniref:Uncharacterized protein n=1 Tax=Octopus vulgaris TaxID=6645 RepID=A0AA36ARW3_OCTVU|nr:Hypothetical predicted protein [Octopus vulgaris]
MVTARYYKVLQETRNVITMTSTVIVVEMCSYNSICLFPYLRAKHCSICQAFDITSEILKTNTILNKIE